MNVELIMLKEGGELREFSIELGKTVIGRKEDCHLRIPLPEISRRHAVMIVNEQSVTLRDLGSANGTYINNKRISEQELAPGDHIVIGPVVFTVRINGEPNEVRPVQTRLEAKAPAGKGKPSADSEDSDVMDTEDLFGGDEHDEDPISALEALASTDETAAFDLNDSFPDLDDSKT